MRLKTLLLYDTTRLLRYLHKMDEDAISPLLSPLLADLVDEDMIEVRFLEIYDQR